MSKNKNYTNYPLLTIFLSNLLSILIYMTGAYIILKFGIILFIIYTCYSLFLEFRILTKSCVNCYYYGRFCGMGKGKLCSFLLKKGDPKKFKNRKITWKNMIPDFLIFILPLSAGIIRLIIDFSWLLLLLLLIFIFLSSIGNSFIRGTLLCRHCKQKKLGCPAAELFKSA